MKVRIVYPTLIMMMLLLGGYTFFAHEHEDVAYFLPIYAFYLTLLSHDLAKLRLNIA